MFLGVKRAWRPFDEPSSRVESGLTARSEAKGRGRDADAFSDCTGMCCQKSPGRNEQHREPRAARLGAGHVSLVTFFAPKKVTRPPGRDPAMMAVEPNASRASSLLHVQVLKQQLPQIHLRHQATLLRHHQAILEQLQLRQPLHLVALGDLRRGLDIELHH